MRRVQSHRHQQGTHLLLKVSLHPAALCRGPVAVGHHTNTHAVQGRHQRLVVGMVLLLNQRMDQGRDTLITADRIAPLVLGTQKGRQVQFGTHLKKFIQIRGHDAEVAQTLQQRHIVSAGPVQHPFVECQNALVPVQQTQRRLTAPQLRQHRHAPTIGVVDMSILAILGLCPDTLPQR